jgi:hypothetical protein
MEHFKYMKGVPRGIRQQSGILAENESQPRLTGFVMDESEPGWKCHALSSSTLADAQENWVRWMQSVKGERSQWKMSGKASKSTGRGLLDTVWKFLGI